MNKGTSLAVAGSIDTTDWVKGDWVKVKHPDKGEGWVLTHGRSMDQPLGDLVVDSHSGAGVITEKPEQKENAAYWTDIVDFLASTDATGAAILDEAREDGNSDLLAETLSEELWLPSYTFSTGEDAPPRATFQGGAWRCERCQRQPPNEDSLLGVERLLGRLTERTFFSPEMTPALGAFSGKQGGLKMVKQAFVTKALDLAIAVTGVLGKRHWTYRWAQILFVDLLISRMQFPGVKRVDRGAYYVLDMLFDLWEWLASLGMAQDPGCFLHGRASEATRLLAPVEPHLDDFCRWRFWQLKERLDASGTQLEILPLRPLIIDGSISFA